jgi:Putative MetA-pathway of phenol degradation
LRLRRGIRILLAGALLWGAAIAPAFAGPPYQTDDPDPTAYRHYEIYMYGSYDADTSHAVNMQLPSLEVNYGLMPNVQFSVSLPFSGVSAPGTPFTAGFGDAEVGLKVRFVQEGNGRPQVAFYPSVDLPTGSVAAGLGNGLPRVFLPIWLQKTNGAWTYFGGGGVQHNPGPGNRDYTFTGFAATRSVRDGLDIGAEIYHQSPATIGGSSETGAGIGFVAQRGTEHAILASIGRDLSGPTKLHAYAAYELYLGPKAAATPSP